MAKNARMIVIKIQTTIDSFINKPEKVVTELQSFRQGMGRTRDEPSSKYIRRVNYLPFEPISIPSGELITVQMEILTKSLVEDFQDITSDFQPLAERFLLRKLLVYVCLTARQVVYHK